MELKIQRQENERTVLEFTMNSDEFEKELDKAFRKEAKHFKVPGFRNGKVPRNVVEKMYGVEVLYETVINDAANEQYKKAIEENKMEIVSVPILDVKQIERGKDFIFTVAVYEKPEAVVKKYKGLEIEKVENKVTKEEVDAKIDSDREKNARVEYVSDRPLREGDISTIDFEGFVDGAPFDGGKAEDYELTIGSNQFIPGFEESMIGMNIGEEKDINVTFPEDYHAENLAGKGAVFKVKLHTIKEKILPELDDEFAKDVSEFDTLEEYRKSVEERLQKEKDNLSKSQKEQKVLDKLIENTEVFIPDDMIDDEVESILDSYRANLSHQGLSLEQFCKYMNKTVSDLQEETKPEAKRNVIIRLALESIAKQEDIKVQDSEIDEKITELLNSYKTNKTSSNLNQNENVRKYMEISIKNQKIIDLIIDSAIEK